MPKCAKHYVSQPFCGPNVEMNSEYRLVWEGEKKEWVWNSAVHEGFVKHWHGAASAINNKPAQANIIIQSHEAVMFCKGHTVLFTLLDLWKYRCWEATNVQAGACTSW